MLEKHGLVAEEFAALHRDRYSVVSEYWAAVRERVEIVDLEPLVPGLVALQQA